MLKVFITFLFMLLCTGATAQYLEGMVLDRELMEPVAGVTIVDLHSGTVVISDSDGHYTISADAGDTLMYRHIAYRTAFEVMGYTLGTRHLSVLMEPLLHRLKEAVVVSRTPYQQDSIEKELTYHHELHKTLVPKPKVVGIGCAGCIGWAADKITGNSKRPKRFRKMYAEQDKIAFIDSRYNPELVIALTPLRDTDSIAAFIYAYPMESDFARQASELELKSWVRNNYRAYMQGAGTKRE